MNNYLQTSVARPPNAFQQQLANQSTPGTPQETPNYVSNTGQDIALPFFGGKDEAARTRAFINRETYNDYLTRFQPYEEDLITDVRGEELLNERLSAIRSDSQENTIAGRKAAIQRQKRFGVQQDDRQAQASETQANISQSASQASLENATRRHIQDRNMAIVSGGPTRQAINTGG